MDVPLVFCVYDGNIGGVVDRPVAVVHLSLKVGPQVTGWAKLGNLIQRNVGPLVVTVRFPLVVPKAGIPSGCRSQSFWRHQLAPIHPRRSRNVDILALVGNVR